MLGEDDIMDDFSQAFSDDLLEDQLEHYSESPLESSQVNSSQLDAVDGPQKKKRRVKAPGLELVEPSRFELELERESAISSGMCLTFEILTSCESR